MEDADSGASVITTVGQAKIVAHSASAQSMPLQYGGVPSTMTRTMTTMAKGEEGESPWLDGFMLIKPYNHPT